MSDKNKIIIFDTTMRDGEQSPGASMSLEEKLQISRCFDELGVDVIEAGFPIASKTCSGVLFNLCFMCSGLVDMKVCILKFFA